MSGIYEKTEVGGHQLRHVVASGESGRTVGDILKNSLNCDLPLDMMHLINRLKLK